MYRTGYTRCLGLLAGVLCAALSVQAQEPDAAPQLTPEQQALLEQQDARMAQAAASVVEMVDYNRIGDIWDGASEVMKQMLSRDDFIREISLDRNRVGWPTHRDGPVVTRSSSRGENGIPPGLYVNVAYSTRFSEQDEPVRELVSFRQDEDRRWRVVGYSLR